MPIDYSKGKIYRIVCNETGEQYFGSTTQTLAQRMTLHRYLAKKEKNACRSKQIIDRGNYDVVLCEECPCETKEQLHACERKWIEENDCVNKYVPGRTTQEAYDEYKKQYYKQYREENREAILKRQRQHYSANREKILEQQRQYRQSKS